jgi:hypothetical protein
MGNRLIAGNPVAPKAHGHDFKRQSNNIGGNEGFEPSSLGVEVTILHENEIAFSVNKRELSGGDYGNYPSGEMPEISRRYHKQRGNGDRQMLRKLRVV